ncbi:MAG: hypothetical protein AABZ47_11730 [Planctomycetota bacterium]
MSSSYQIFLQGAAASADFYDRLNYLEVEENADLPGALQLRVPVYRGEDGEPLPIDDAAFAPLSNVSIVATVEDMPPECIFDGYVLSHKIHMETGLTGSYLEVYAQDASWLMNLEEKTREWANVTDGIAANTIFGEYGIAPSPDNLVDDSPAHTEDGHTLMQRGSDIEFLRMLGRRSGKLCRVVSEAPGARMGFFAKPSVETEPVVTLRPNDIAAPNIRSLDIEWDIMRPTSVRARQALFTDSTPEGASGDTDASGLASMDERDLATFSGTPMTAMLTVPVDDAGELRQRADAVLREAGWFVRCSGEADVSLLQTVLRVGRVVKIETLGSVHSGNYFVWSVRHRIEAQSHKMQFVLVRNAVGPAPSGSSLGGLI